MSIRDRLGAVEYARLCDDATAYRGNTARLFEALHRAQVRLAFLGGSVTAGCLDNVLIPDCFPALLTEQLHLADPQRRFEWINLGASGTASLYGLVTAARTFSAQPPDVICLEYAVNEAKSRTGMEQFEGLVRFALALPNQPAVVLVLLRTKTNYSCADVMLEIARHYRLPVVHLADPLSERLAAGALRWSDYSPDDAHPNRDGHGLIADCLQRLFARAQAMPPFALPQSPRYGAGWEALRLVDFSDRARVQTDFTLQQAADGTPCLVHSSKGGGSNHRVRLSLVCKKAVGVYLQSSDRCFGEASVYADGVALEPWRGYSIFGWNNPVVGLLADEAACRERRFCIALEGDEGQKEFHLLAVGYCP